MPSFKDLEVHITKEDGTPLPEYGIHTMNKSSLVSCYVESKTDMPFRISVRPSLPFPAFDEEDDEDEAYYDRRYRRKRSAPPARKRNEVPYHLLATVRINGRKEFEKQAIIYLSAYHPNFNRRTFGQALMTGKMLRNPGTGGIVQTLWAFNDVGIDTLLSAMNLGGDAESAPVGAGDELANAFGKLGREDGEEEEEASQTGKIDVEIEKVTVNDDDRGFWTPEKRSEQDGSGQDDLGGDSGSSTGKKADLKDVGHTVGRVRATRINQPVQAVYFTPVKDGKYATFRFFYRKADVLQRLGFFGEGKGAAAPSPTLGGKLAAKKLVGTSDFAAGKSVGIKREVAEGEEGGERKKTAVWLKSASAPVVKEEGGEDEGGVSERQDSGWSKPREKVKFSLKPGAPGKEMKVKDEPEDEEL